jgi:DNA invertase Pin-like site-specific DNA recombinase
MEGSRAASIDLPEPGEPIINILCSINPGDSNEVGDVFLENMAARPKAYSYLRMSTDLQLKGDSRRRQLEASRLYADKNDLDLAEDAQLEDIGISAFKGANVRDGALGRFLKAVKLGLVKPGSYLIVESLDRLSREKLLPAQALFLSIIQAGINLVTLMDGRLYRANQADLGDLIMSLVIMSRAHEESQIKSQRISAAWQNKRALAAQSRPMTKICPAWLKLSGDRKAYEVMPDRAVIIKQIFEDAAGGVGMYSIARQLNRSSIPAFVGRNGWHQSYIAKVLANRAVFGEFQPSKTIDGKRSPDGSPIPGYFPTIVTEDLFYRANLSKSERKVTGKGRKGIGYTNLFTGLASCAYCSSRIVFENKGNGPKGGSYLVCDSAKRNRGCKATRWRYADFEASFLGFVEEIDIGSIIRADANAESRKQLSDELDALRGELASVDSLMEKTFDVLAAGGPVEFVTGKLNELKDKQSRLRRESDTKMLEQATILSMETRLNQSRDEIRQLVTRLQGPATDELYKIRAQIASRLKTLVNTLIIGPLGNRPTTLRVIEQLEGLNDPSTQEVIEHMKSMADDPNRSQRFFAIGFEGNTVRVVYPDKNDALSVKRQIITSNGKITELP